VLALDWVYVIAGVVVPTATVLGLRVWLVRSRSGGQAHSVADQDNSELARSIAVVRERLAELTGQLETMSRDWEERDRRLTTQLNMLLALTERPRRFDLSVGDRPGARRSSRK
jgi:hypothetical protein